MPRYATKKKSIRRNKERTAAVGILSGFFVLVFGLLSANFTETALVGAAVTGISVEEIVEIEAPVTPGESTDTYEGVDPETKGEETKPDSEENGIFSQAMAVALVSTPQQDETDPEKGAVAEGPVSEEAQATEKPDVETGEASYYGPEFEESVSPEGAVSESENPTAAHRSLPLGSEVQVTNLENGKTVTVEINNRGPFVANRLIDLSQGAAEELGIKSKDSVPVKLEVVS